LTKKLLIQRDEIKVSLTEKKFRYSIFDRRECRY